MKRRYANGRTKKKVLYELELDTLDRLDKIMKEQIFASRKKERMKAVAVARKSLTSLTEVLQCQKIVERRPSRRWSTEESILVRKNAGWRNGDATPNTERECG